MAARYTVAVSAHRAWLEQMLLEAFSRRMCCSRACRVSTKATFACGVHRLAHDAARQFAHHCFRAGHDAQVGAAKGKGHAQGLAFRRRRCRRRTRAGVFSMPRAMGLQPMMYLAPFAWTIWPQLFAVFQQAVVVGLLHIEGKRWSSSSSCRRASMSVRPSLAGTTTSSALAASQ